MPAPDYDTYAKRLAIAAREADTNPTQAQREAGNHRVGHMYLHGLDISIEVPKDGIRRGKDKDGNAWSKRVTAHYGRIRRTRSSGDGEPVDVWIGSHPSSQLVYVFDQLNHKGEFDEHKVVAGIRNIHEAKKIIRDNYPEGHLENNIGEIRGMTMEQFRQWLKSHAPTKSKHTESEQKQSSVVTTSKLLSIPCAP